MDVYLVTTNEEKFQEISKVMALKGVIVHKLALEKSEDKEHPIDKVAADNAKAFAESEHKPIIVDDTGVFFDAYPDFPGANAKWVYNLIGYKGILKLVEGKDRGMRFKTAAAFCSPGKKPVVVVESLKGALTTEVYGEAMEMMPYERIFIRDGDDKAMCFMDRYEKNRVSHRAKAFSKLATMINNI
ncbi:MAG: non-canonical purine NTP pyrophosphatase [Nanoarchaeota archaeon]